MFLTAHRSRAPRRLVADRRERVLIFARDPELRRWIDHELFGEAVASDYVDALADVVSSLTLVPPPWPQYLIVDMAEVSPGDVELLAVIRSSGWPGMVIAIGEASKPMQKLLGIDVILPRTTRIGSELLRRSVRTVGLQRPTMRMRRLAR
jgi:hypothetical protein